jgi:eukaryotic-like serine/threonine-protein kinase
MSSTSAEILFEKYEISACLKKDSYSAVYLANHIYLGKKIILKTLDTVELKDDVILERFKREARILAQLDHPNLIKVLDFGTYGNNFYISFEHFESTNLRELLNQKNLSYDQKHHLLVQILKALNVSHQNNIVHRDIKPENILVNRNYELKIADFGLAFSLNDNSITNKASIVGTPGYMSPEQIRGDELGIHSDIFSAGIVAIELFTGENPFIGKNINDTINNILSYKDDAISEKINGLSPAIQQAIRMMLKKNPPERGKNVNEVLGILGVASEFFTPVEVKVQKKRRNKTVLISSASLSLFVTLIMLYFLTNDKELPESSFGNKELMFFSEFSVPETSSSTIQTDSSGIIAAAENKPVAQGRLLVKVYPYADVYINNRRISSTPLEDYITLAPGFYTIKLINPDFPEYKRRVEVISDKIETVDINLKELAGYLDCQLYPWGEIYINDELKGQTPMRQPILLFPGRYKLTVKNPKYGSVSEDIRITSKNVSKFYYNFEDNKKF